MSKRTRFWRNAVLIAAAHVVLMLGIIRGSRGSEKRAAGADVVWLNPDAAGSAEVSETSIEDTPEPTVAPPSPATPTPAIQAAASEISLSTPSPSIAVTPSPTAVLTATPTPKPKGTPKPVASPAPKMKKPVVTPAPKAKPKATVKTAVEKPVKASAKPGSTAGTKASRNIANSKPASGGGNGTPSGGSTNGLAPNPDSDWYKNMLEARFTGAWVQPTSVKATGEIIATAVQIRIEKDGRVTHFEIVKPSGNIVVDESVSAVAAKVTRVDPLPKAMGNGEHYDVTINFKWDPAQ